MNNEIKLFKDTDEKVNSIFEKVSDYLVSIYPESKGFIIAAGKNPYFKLLSGHTRELYECEGTIQLPYRMILLVRDNIRYDIILSDIIDPDEIRCLPGQSMNPNYIKINFEDNTVTKEFSL